MKKNTPVFVGRASAKHPEALLHPQSLVVTLSWRRCNFFSDGLSTCGLPYRDDTTTGKRQIDNRQGGITRTCTLEHTHAHTRCKAQPQSQRCVQLQRTYQMVQCKYHSRPAANLITVHWWHLIYDYSTSPRRNPSSLVNVLQSAQGDRIGPWPMARWCRICPHANQCSRQPSAITEIPTTTPLPGGVSDLRN